MESKRNSKENEMHDNKTNPRSQASKEREMHEKGTSSRTHATGNSRGNSSTHSSSKK